MNAPTLTTCTRCDQVTYSTNGFGDVIDHPSLELCLRELARRVTTLEGSSPATRWRPKQSVPVTVIPAVDESELTVALVKHRIPMSLRPGIVRYVCHHIEPGSFLKAVFSNQLHETWRAADDASWIVVGDLLNLLYNDVPGSCWGSAENVKAWLEASR